MTCRSSPRSRRGRRSRGSRSFAYDRSVERVVVLGNGIAGVTAADHVRRRHPLAQIDLVAEESHHLYNRMGIARLIYGRSAMQGLYLNPDAWYDEHAITPWLNTRARTIDRAGAAGAARHRREAAVRPADPRHGLAPVRAADRRLRRGRARSCCARPTTRSALRAFAQRHGARRAVVAGGGLLGLEAAYALHKLGLRTDGARARRPAAAAPARRARVGAPAATTSRASGSRSLTRGRDGRGWRRTAA